MHQQLLSTRLFAVEHREYPRTGRAPVARDVVIHPGAVAILPILDGERVVMIRNYRYAVEQELWELPAGTREPNEPPIETARRELEEETGYRAGSLTPLTEFYTSPGFVTERMHVFLASDLTSVGQGLEDTEQISVEIMDMAEAHRKLIDGEFLDGKTVAILGMYFTRRASPAKPSETV